MGKPRRRAPRERPEGEEGTTGREEIIEGNTTASVHDAATSR